MYNVMQIRVGDAIAPLRPVLVCKIQDIVEQFRRKPHDGCVAPARKIHDSWPLAL